MRRSNMGTLRRSTREDDAEALPWSGIHENAAYLERRRSTRATQDSHSSSLAEELPGAFRLVDTASARPEDLVLDAIHAVHEAGDAARCARLLWSCVYLALQCASGYQHWCALGHR